MDNNIALIIALGSLILLVLVFVFLKYQEIQKEKERVSLVNKMLADKRITFLQAKTIIEKRIAIEFTPELVLLSWGKPNRIDQQEITKSGLVKERWVYGIAKPSKPANYVFFSRTV